MSEWIDLLSKEKSFVMCDRKNYLWVIHADKIPPHIGISVNNYYFSLKVNGKDVKYAISKLLNVLNSKLIPCLVIELTTEFTLDLINMVYSHYSNKIIKNQTCLTPILELFKQNNSLIIHELLADLYSKDCLKAVFGLNLPEDFVSIPTYNKTIVDQHIFELQYAKRR